ncbi:MAG: peroxide stress protein YaaA [Anaerotignum sp.]|nr:peroxide stress protein YaaA [Anaerotignum sp.]
MRVIISPAKKMKTDTDTMDVRGLPAFLSRTEEVCRKLQGMSYDALKALWKCNDKITKLNVGRLAQMDLRKNLTPAILSYEGIQYQYMAPGVFSDREFAYVQEQLRILSGFYGVLKPFDGVVPYRLEMQAKLSVDGAKDLYAYWGDSLAKHLSEETDCIINLASKEYSQSVSGYLPESVRFITCVFGEWNGGKIVEKGTICKMARGEMVRFLAENQIEDPEEIKAFSRLQYRYSAEHSDENTFVFLLQKGSE